MKVMPQLRNRISMHCLTILSSFVTFQENWYLDFNLQKVVQTKCSSSMAFEFMCIEQHLNWFSHSNTLKTEFVLQRSVGRCHTQVQLRK